MADLSLIEPFLGDFVYYLAVVMSPQSRSYKEPKNSNISTMHTWWNVFLVEFDTFLWYTHYKSWLFDIFTLVHGVGLLLYFTRLQIK